MAHPAPGAEGGRDGSTGDFTDIATSADLPRKQLVRLKPDSCVRLRFPGGGGFGDPHQRPVEMVLADVVNGYVSIEAARDEYGVAVEYTGRPDAIVRPPSAYRIDDVQTGQLRLAATPL